MSTLQVASQSWMAFDWGSRMTQLDKAAAQAKEQKDQSLAARKHLAETTKQFKRSVKSMEGASAGLVGESYLTGACFERSEVDGKLAKECRTTVKAYQEEIDNLTRRCKGSETTFSSIHQGLSEVPDPTSLLSTAFEQIRSQQTQLNQLLRTVDEVNREMANMETNYSQQRAVYQKEIAQLKASQVG